MDAALVELFKHNRWANLALLDLCASLDAGLMDAAAPGVFGTVAQTLFHFLDSEDAYVYRLVNGHPRPRDPNQDRSPGLELLRLLANNAGRGLVDFAAAFEPGRLYACDWDDGNDYNVPVEILLVQAINHSTEHRTQVITILSQHGVQVPELSGWTYFEDTVLRLAYPDRPFPPLPGSKPASL